MTTSRFLLVGGLGLACAAACLALAAVLDSAALAVAGTVLVAGVLAARARWMSSGRSGQWLLTVGLLLAVVVVAFLAQKLTG